jgi:DNA modification methylase
MEETLEEHLAALVESFREVRRVLRRDGSLFVWMGDIFNESGRGGGEGGTWTYRGRAKGRIRLPGFRRKELIGLPWRVTFALQADGWLLRRDIIWFKKNPRPEPARDRPASAHDFGFLLTRRSSYYYDGEDFREPHQTPFKHRRRKQGKRQFRGNESLRPRGNLDHDENPEDRYWNRSGRALRDVWEIATHAFRGAHTATFPPELARRCILLGTSDGGACAECGKQLARVLELGPHDVEHQRACGADENRTYAGRSLKDYGAAGSTQAPNSIKRRVLNSLRKRRTAGWAPVCKCEAPSAPAVVLDPFAGSGTTGVVALEQGRSFVGIDLNPRYVAMARRRINLEVPFLGQELRP